ncbi:MAG: ADP-ribosylation factor-like protein [Candidatus Hodarchaeales archaeon]|jgi:GTPase SAR1 family protein
MDDQDDQDDHWVSKRERTSRLGHKILIAGLSEAGKTAIKRVFFMKQKADDVDNLEATINYERMAFNIANVPITIIDLGGQRVFVQRFLSEFSPFIFSSVKIFIFVIDVAVKSTRNNAIQYFSSCLEKLKEYSPETKFFVFLHKNDLVRSLQNYKSVHDQLKKKFQLESKDKVNFFRTTIYKPETVIKSFGRAIEIAIPRLAKSKYVDGMTIGQVEEYAEKHVTTVEVESGFCPKCGNEFITRGNILVCNSCGHEKSLSLADSTSSRTSGENEESIEKKLELMKDTMVGKEEGKTATHDKPQAVTADEGVAALDKLMGLMKHLPEEDKIETTPQPLPERIFKVVIMGDAGAGKTCLLAKYLEDVFLENPRPTPGVIVKKKEEIITISDRRVRQDQATLDKSNLSAFQIDFLTSFYGIKEQEAKKIIENGQDSIFEEAAQAGVPIPVILEVLLQHVPFLKTKRISTEIIEDRVLDVLFAHLGGIVREDEILKSLVYATKEPAKSIEEIVKEYLIGSRKERIDKLREVFRPDPEVVEPTPKVPAIEIDKSITQLSKSEQVGFKVKKEDSNCRLIFYQGNNLLDSTLVSSTISISELEYMLAFEANLPIKEDYYEFIEKSALIINESIQRLFNLGKLQDHGADLDKIGEQVKQEKSYQKRQFEYWDLGEQGLIDQIQTINMKGSDGIILCFNLNDEKSIVRTLGDDDHSIGKFIKEMIKIFGKDQVKDIPILLVGTKDDLPVKVDSRRVDSVIRKLRKADMNIISHEKSPSGEMSAVGKHHLKSNRMREAEKWRTGPGWISTSSKLGTGVHDVFDIIKKVLFEASALLSEE